MAAKTVNCAPENCPWDFDRTWELGQTLERLEGGIERVERGVADTNVRLARVEERVRGGGGLGLKTGGGIVAAVMTVAYGIWEYVSRASPPKGGAPVLLLGLILMSGCARGLDPRAPRRLEVRVGDAQLVEESRSPVWVEPSLDAEWQTVSSGGVTTTTARFRLGQDSAESAGLFNSIWGRLMTFLAGVFAHGAVA